MKSSTTLLYKGPSHSQKHPALPSKKNSIYHSMSNLNSPNGLSLAAPAVATLVTIGGEVGDVGSSLSGGGVVLVMMVVGTQVGVSGEV
jgi:hypothetical protein